MRRNLLIAFFVVDAIAIVFLVLRLRGGEPASGTGSASHGGDAERALDRPADRPAGRGGQVDRTAADPTEVNTTDPNKPYVPPEQPTKHILPADPLPSPPPPAYAPPPLEDPPTRP